MNVKWVIALIVVFTVGGCNSTQAGSSQNMQTQQSTFMSFEEKISNGEVTISLSPEYQKGVLKVAYSINTHTADLSGINLQEQISLNMDGKKINPSSPNSLSGHHNSGILEFNVNEIALPFEIIVKDVPDIQLRRFEWNSTS